MTAINNLKNGALLVRSVSEWKDERRNRQINDILNAPLSCCGGCSCCGCHCDDEEETDEIPA